LKKSAVAGAVFWSVPVIESITSAAAAASPTGPITCSWAYVVYADASGNIFVAGYQHTGATNDCHSYGTNNLAVSTATATHAGNSYAFTLNVGPPGSGPFQVTYSVNGGSLIHGVQPPDCTSLTQSGNTVTAAPGVTILAWFAHSGSTIFNSGTMTNPPAGNSVPINCSLGF
jgi:hypothetical protein